VCSAAAGRGIAVEVSGAELASCKRSPAVPAQVHERDASPRAGAGGMTQQAQRGSEAPDGRAAFVLASGAGAGSREARAGTHRTPPSPPQPAGLPAYGLPASARPLAGSPSPTSLALDAPGRLPPPKPPVLGLRPSGPSRPSLPDTAAGAGIAGAQANSKGSARKRGQPPMLGAAAAAAAGMIKAAVCAATGKPKSARSHHGAGALEQPGSAAVEAAGASGSVTARQPAPPPARHLSREHAHSWAGDSEYYRDSASEVSSSGGGR
jgi:hypothetical protein